MIKPLKIPEHIEPMELSGYRMEDGILKPETFLVPKPEMKRIGEHEYYSARHHIDHIYEFYECFPCDGFGHPLDNAYLEVGVFPGEYGDSYLFSLWTLPDANDFILIYAETPMDYYDVLARYLPIIRDAAVTSQRWTDLENRKLRREEYQIQFQQYKQWIQFPRRKLLGFVQWMKRI